MVDRMEPNPSMNGFGVTDAELTTPLPVDPATWARMKGQS
jgi:hypothetical protein